MLHEVFKLLAGNSFFEILLIAVALDTILGVLRAIKEHKFNSCVGIDGAIRKVAMLLSVGLLMLTDIIMHINSSLMSLNQLGVGPKKAFAIANSGASWKDLL